MDTKTLRYFLTACEHGSIAEAATASGVSQSKLSRQVQALEGELGVALFVRGNRGRQLSLTRDGQRFRRRAQEIVMMAERAERELLSSADDVAGDVYIGAAECEAMSDVCRVMATVRERCPRTMFHVRSGNGPDAMEWLRQGVVDFAVLIEPVDLTGFNHLQLPVRDRQSVMVRRDHPLAALESVKPEDLAGFPIIVPSGSLVCNEFSGWLGGRMERLNVVGTSNLIQNAVMMVKAGYGCFIGLEDSLLDVGGEICFRPLSPRIDVRASLAWMEDRPLSLASETFLAAMRRSVDLA